MVRGTEGWSGDRPERGESRVASLARIVRGRREELGLRQSELADLAGCSERFIHTIEHGKSSLRMDKVLDVLEVLGLDLLVASGRGQVGVVPDAEPGSREGR